MPEFTASFDSLGTGVIVEFDATNYYSDLKTYEYQIVANASGAIMIWPVEIEVYFDCANSNITYSSSVSGDDIKTIAQRPVLTVNIDIAVSYQALTHTFFQSEYPTLCPLA